MGDFSEPSRSPSPSPAASLSSTFRNHPGIGFYQGQQNRQSQANVAPIRERACSHNVVPSHIVGPSHIIAASLNLNSADKVGKQYNYGPSTSQTYQEHIFPQWYRGNIMGGSLQAANQGSTTGEKVVKLSRRHVSEKKKASAYQSGDIGRDWVNSCQPSTSRAGNIGRDLFNSCQPSTSSAVFSPPSPSVAGPSGMTWPPSDNRPLSSPNLSDIVNIQAPSSAQSQKRTHEGQNDGESQAKELRLDGSPDFALPVYMGGAVAESSTSEESGDQEVDYVEDTEPAFDRTISTLEHKLTWLWNLKLDKFNEDDVGGISPWEDIRCHYCYCTYTYATIFKHLISHVFERENERVGIEEKGLCTHCMRNFPEDSQQNRHRLIMAKYGRFANMCEFEASLICIFCNAENEFRNRNEYLEHMIRKHKKPDMSYYCQICQSRANTLFEFRQHMQEHYAVFCEYCHHVFAPITTWTRNKGFGQPCELVEVVRDHIYDHMLVQSAFACDKCPLVFLTDEALLEHSSRHGNDKIIHPCDADTSSQWENGRGIGDFPFEGVKKVLQAIPNHILSKTNRSIILGMSQPDIKVILEKNDDYSSDEQDGEQIAPGQIMNLTGDEESNSRGEPSHHHRKEKIYHNFRNVYVFSDLAEELKKRMLFKELTCRECGQNVGIPNHYLMKQRTCRKQGCEYTTSCLLSLNQHAQHCRPLVTPVRAPLLRGRSMEYYLLPEYEEAFNDVLDLENDKILICRICNFLAKSLPDLIIHSKKKKHFGMIIDDGEEKEEEEEEEAEK